MRAYTWLDRFGVTPRPGGLLAQSKGFVTAVRLIDGERGALEEARRQEAQKRGG
jgi:hypothetical protein